MAITLLTGIGSKKEVDWIDVKLMECCIEELRALGSDRGIDIDQSGKLPPLQEIPRFDLVHRYLQEGGR